MWNRDINDHPIHAEISRLCWLIERLPALEQETRIVEAAGAMHESADKIITALRDSISVYQDHPNPVPVVDERIEAWRLAAGYPPLGRNHCWPGMSSNWFPA